MFENSVYTWQDTLNRREQAKKFVFLSVGVLVALTILFLMFYSIVTLVHRSGKIETQIYFYPQNTQVFVDGTNKNVNNTKIFLSEGEHTFSAFLDGYLYQDFSFYVNEYNTNITSDLTPITSFDFRSFSAPETEASVEYEIKSIEDERQRLEKLEPKFPILKYLPYNTANEAYGINYQLNDNYTELKIIIKSARKNDLISLTTACNVLKGFDPEISVSTYDIAIENFENVFEGKFQNNTETDPQRFLETGFRSVDDFYVEKGARRGNYYYTNLQKSAVDSQTGNSHYFPHKAVLKWENGGWKLLGAPNLLLTTRNTPDVSTEILDLANFYYAERSIHE